MVDSDSSLGPSGESESDNITESHRFQLLLHPPLWELSSPNRRGFLQTSPTRLSALGEHTPPNWDYSSAKPLHSPEPRAQVWEGSLNLAFNPKSRGLYFGEVFPGSASARLPCFSQAQRSAAAGGIKGGDLARLLPVLSRKDRPRRYPGAKQFGLRLTDTKLPPSP